MKGWLILRHSLRQVFGNLNGALRVSLVLYLAQGVIGLLLGVGAMSMGSSPGMGMGAGFLGGALIAAIAAVISGLWIAVAWHRYVLLGEEGGVIPTFRGDRIWAYFLRGLGYGIILGIIALVWGAIVGFVIGGLITSSPVFGIVLMGVLVYLPVLVIGFRMTADLPAMALGANSEFLSGWKATEGQTADIAALALILVAAAIVIGILGFFIMGMGPLAIVWQLVIGWVQMMVGASILTTLYGHYVEKRELV